MAIEPVLLNLDSPTHRPTGRTLLVAGWVASAHPIQSIQIRRPGGATSEPLAAIERPDVAAAHSGHPHVQGFRARLGEEWASDGEIALVCHSGGREHRLDRILVPPIDYMAKRRKLERIAPLLDPAVPARLRSHHFDCLGDETTMGEDSDAPVSRNAYDPIALEILNRHRDGLVLDAGAGFRDPYLPQVVNLEIVPYPTTDVLATGERLPFLDNCFDAVLSLSVLEHVQDPFQCARELARVLKPGGTLYAAVPFLQPYHGYPHHYYNMTHRGLANLFAGRLEIVDQTVLPSGAPIWTLTWFLRSYAEGLPAAERARFEQMTVGELAAADPASLLNRPFVSELPAAKQFELAAATMLIARKPGG